MTELKENNESAIPLERIVQRILWIRGQKVMLDADLAELYGVPTGQLNRAVKRNKERFPADFMFQLSAKEFADLKCQLGTASWGGRRTAPYVFTEHGVAMLSSVLHSKQAVLVNIEIMRAFVRLRHALASREELTRKLVEMEQKLFAHDRKFKMVFEAIHAMMEPGPTANRIGFVLPSEES